MSPREKNWKFAKIEEVLRNVKPTRKSVLTDKHFCHYKVKYKDNAEQKNYDQRPRFSTKEDKRTPIGVHWASLSCVSKGISLHSRNFLN